MKKPTEAKWLERPAEKDFKAAETFLQLLYGPKKARGYSKNLAKANLAKYAARDLLRASETPVAEVQAFDWAKQRSEITAGTPMSPILLIRQENGGHLIVADGFHRLCAVFSIDQDALIPCFVA